MKKIFIIFIYIFLIENLNLTGVYNNKILLLFKFKYYKYNIKSKLIEDSCVNNI